MGKQKQRTKSRSDSEARSSKMSKKSKKKTAVKEKRKNWSVDLDNRFRIMKAAVEDVIERKMTIRNAAKKWGVKRSTLADRVSGRVDLGRRSGPPSILTRAEEQMLAEWIISMAQRGYGFKKHKLLKTVKKILDKDKRTTMLKRNMPGNKWFRQFVMRNPRVKIVTSNQQLQGTSQGDMTGKHLGVDYERFNSMVSAYNESESTSEGESESESEAESDLGSEMGEESQPESPGQGDYTTEVFIESEAVLTSDPEPKEGLHLESHIPNDSKTGVVESDPAMKQESPANVMVASTADLGSSPDISVANTVTITTSE